MRLAVATGARRVVAGRIRHSRAAGTVNSFLLADEHLEADDDLNSDRSDVERRQARVPSDEHDQLNHVASLDACHVVHIVEEQHLGNLRQATGPLDVLFSFRQQDIMTAISNTVL